MHVVRARTCTRLHRGDFGTRHHCGLAHKLVAKQTSSISFRCLPWLVSAFVREPTLERLLCGQAFPDCSLRPPRPPYVRLNHFRERFCSLVVQIRVGVQRWRWGWCYAGDGSALRLALYALFWSATCGQAYLRDRARLTRCFVVFAVCGRERVLLQRR